jgi:Plasma-membrane choline transporter
VEVVAPFKVNNFYIQREDPPIMALIVGVIFAYLIADCFVTVFEMIVDTIFISFCDDCEENNGMDRPYYMSHSLMKTMQEMKVFVGGDFNFNGNPGLGQHVEAGAQPMLPVGWNISK